MDLAPPPVVHTRSHTHTRTHTHTHTHTSPSLPSPPFAQTGVFSSLVSLFSLRVFCFRGPWARGGSRALVARSACVLPPAASCAHAQGVPPRPAVGTLCARPVASFCTAFEALYSLSLTPFPGLRPPLCFRFDGWLCRLSVVVLCQWMGPRPSCPSSTTRVQSSMRPERHLAREMYVH